MKRQNDEIKNHPNVKGQVPPHSEEAEKALLGSLLMDENVPMELLPLVKATDFYYRSHKLIYEAMTAIWNDNRPIDLVTVTQELDRRGALAEVGGAGYLSALSDFMPTSANFKAHADIVKKTSQLRQLASASNSILEKCFAGEDSLETLHFAEKAVSDVAENQGISALTPFENAVNEAVADFDSLLRDPLARRGLQTGFRDIDSLLGGLHGGDLVIIAARPGQGKTSIGMNIVQKVATAHLEKGNEQAEPKVCAIFSLEMPASQLAKRMIASIAEVDFSRLSKGELKGAKEWKNISSARSALCRSKIFVDDTSLTTPMDILSKCRRLKREQKRLDLVMVDYLTLMSSGKRVENRQQDVSEISRTMKLAAKELDVPILLLSQLSRGSEKEKRKPQMSDLRESGAIEQDADIIMFIYRPNVQDDNAVEKDVAEIIVAKHRNGPLGTVKMRWVGEHVSFENWEEGDNRSANADRSADNVELQKGMVQSLTEVSGEDSPFD
ncbi:MAG: replicative DNA helicase [Clostridia bacterium]|nr:replicative DNA helicase [Clostridia bacterium]